MPDEPPDAWPACPVVWEGPGQPRSLPDVRPSWAIAWGCKSPGNEVMLIRARGKGYTARWVWRKPEAKPCTEAYILRTRRGGLVEPA